MRYRRQHRRKSNGEEAFEIMAWLIDWKWQIGATLAFASLTGFFISLESCLRTRAQLEANEMARMIPEYVFFPIFAWPMLFLLVAIFFAWMAIRSWLKSQEASSRWY